MEGEGALDGAALARETLVIDSGAAADDVGDGQAGEGGGDGAGGGGVADAHLAEAEEIAAFGGGLGGESDAGGERGMHFGRRHGGLDAKVARGGGGAAADDAIEDGQRREYADVGNLEVDSTGVCEGVDGGTAAQEVGDHLGGDFLRIGADALGADAVIGGEDARCAGA